MVNWNRKIHKMANSLFLLINTRSGLQAEIEGFVSILANFMGLLSWTDSSLCMVKF